jgi:hypothetical protein
MSVEPKQGGTILGTKVSRQDFRTVRRVNVDTVVPGELSRPPPEQPVVEFDRRYADDLAGNRLNDLV